MKLLPLSLSLTLSLFALAGCDTAVSRTHQSVNLTPTAEKPVAFQVAPRADQRLSMPDGAEAFVDQLDDYFEGTATHRTHVQLDRPLYRPGETVWVKSWDLTTRGMSASASKSITYELVEPKGTVVMSKLVQVAGGSASNDFALASGAAGGKWKIRARTLDGLSVERPFIVSNFQAPNIKKTLEFVREAYGPGDAVEAAVTLERSTGEKLANLTARALVQIDGQSLEPFVVETDGNGEALVQFDLPETLRRPDVMLTILVDDGGVTESISRLVPVVLGGVNLTFYPEGGDWVAGLDSRLYFEATDAMGEPADVSGVIVDDRGEVVAPLKSWHDGRGRAQLVGESGRRYFARIDMPANLDNPFFPLPRTVDTGCTMTHYDDLDGAQRSVRVSVACTDERDVILVAAQQEQVVDSAAVHVREGKSATVHLRTGESVGGAQGIARVTLLDGAMQPLAERLVYRNKSRALNVEITAAEDQYGPREEVVLQVTTTDPDGLPVPAEIAVSVVDDTLLSYADDEEGNLLSRLYLQADLPEPLDDAGFYFDDEEEDANLALDLVLGTRGWRRFDWVAVNSFDAVVARAGAKKAKALEARVSKAATRWQPEVLPEMELALDQMGHREMHMQPVPPPMAAPMPALMAAPVVNQPVAANGLLDVAREPAAARDRGGDEWMGDLEKLGYIADFEDAAGEDKNVGHGWLGRQDQGRAFQVHSFRTTQAYAAVRVFPTPVYQPDAVGQRSDFRDTVFWAPKVQTDERGTAELRFHLSDAVTGFKATAEGIGGGFAGQAESLIVSKLPFHLDVKLPQQLSFGDQLLLPVTIENQRSSSVDVSIDAQLGALLLLDDGLPGPMTLTSGARNTAMIPVTVAQARGLASLSLTADANGLKDTVTRTIPVVPRGYPASWTGSGVLEQGAAHAVVIPDALKGSITAELTLFPSVVSTMLEGVEGMVRTPGGCFEQTSSTNYPNILILDYLDRTGGGGKVTVDRTKVLKVGYDKLTGYQVEAGGFETWGTGPGKEALSAYGLLEFADMQSVYPVDPSIIEKDVRYLYDQRDGKGGFRVSGQSAHGYGSAPPEVLNAYITWALVETGHVDLAPELDALEKMTRSSTDAYRLSLAAMSLLKTRKEAGLKATNRLVSLQAEDGSFPGSETSIMRSGGQNLLVEATALSTMALFEAGKAGEALRGVRWLHDHKNGPGTWGATQANVLALKALSMAAEQAVSNRGPATVEVWVDDALVQTIPYDGSDREAIGVNLADWVGEGSHQVVLKHDGKTLPYALDVAWTANTPVQGPQRALDVHSDLAKGEVNMGEMVRLTTLVSNRTTGVVPDPIARIGLPAGLQPQTWQLEKLVKSGKVAFYETRPREVTLYWDGIGADETHEVILDLVAEVPGRFEGPATSAYPYYDDSFKAWAAGTKIRVK